MGHWCGHITALDDLYTHVQITAPHPPRHASAATAGRTTCSDWAESRKKVANGVKTLLADVDHLVERDPAPQAYGRRAAEGILSIDPPPNQDPITSKTTPTPDATVGAPTTKTTYSSAVKAAIPPPASSSPATKPPTRKTPQKPRTPDKAPPPSTSRAAPQRLILRFSNSSVVKTLSDPQRLRDSLNEALNCTSKLRGVNRSRGGNLVLHAQAPYTAVQLREHEQTIWNVVHPYFTLLERDRPRFNLDKPWHRIVVYRVPVTNDSSRSLVEELRWSNDDIGTLADVMGVRDLRSFEGLQKRGDGLQKALWTPKLVKFTLSLTGWTGKCTSEYGVFSLDWLSVTRSTSELKQVNTWLKYPVICLN
ncbi:hypothetical protein B0H13DRAFT_2326660 [Mycena leptocephala]|nr:hypothetical protein B0H13DRAFT_2326660 [Mycena leptocephala]